MGLFSKTPQQRKLADAKQALDDYGRKAKRQGIRTETPEYRRLNDAVIQAERDVPWWQR